MPIHIAGLFSVIWGVLLLFAAIAAAPFIIERRKPDMDPEVRESAGGQFAKLSDGHTHFKWHGPEDGHVLVCIHGLITPQFVWDNMIPGLTDAGFRVLTYDLYGRGWSDRPRGVQTRSFFMRQLRDLLQDQGVERDFSVIGYSMGGSIAAVFTAEEPERVRQLYLLAPAGMEHRPSKFDEFVRLGGRTGEWAMLAAGGYLLAQGAKNAPTPPEFQAQLVDQPRWRGYLPSVLSSQRNLLANELEEEHRSIAQANIPVAAIWGELDTVIPLSAMGKLAEWNRDVSHTTIPNADHSLGVTHANEVVQAIVKTAKP